jgi:hypothetical protein
MGVTYSFTTVAVSNLGHALEFQFDWGDGTFSSWGSSTQSKSWNRYGTFKIKVKARCKTQPIVESEWSDEFDFNIETVSIPSAPTGPTYGMKGISYSYSTSGAVSSSGHPVEYQFDWGDGIPSPWGDASQSKIWSNSGSYIVKVRARCKLHPTIVTDWSPGLAVVMESVSAPTAPTGPTSGTVGEGYYYTTGGSSSDLGHAIQYQFDWGDGKTSEWLPVGTTGTSKSWANPGTYVVRAQARCSIHTVVISGWSAVIIVTINPSPPPASETVSIPSPPTGQSINGMRGKPLNFTVSGAVSNLGHSVEYQFDWKGDGTDLSSWGSGSQSKNWSVSGIYTVRARARCSVHPSIISDWSSGLVVVIEFVSIPTTPSGPTSGTIDEIYPFITGGSSSDSGDPVQYQFDWGDGTYSGWLSVGVLSVGKAWKPGTYAVKAQARCAIHTNVISDWSAGKIITISPLPPSPEKISTPTTPTGENLGDIGVTYEFKTGGSLSTLGHSVEYQFDWGDGSFSAWGSATQSKSWNTLGTFVVRARARCATDTSVVSDWSSGLSFVIEVVTIPSQPAGPLNGMRGQPNKYTVGGALSTRNDPLEYQFDWDDGSLSNWISATTDPETGISTASEIKTWTTSGTYKVRARARCQTHPTLVSDWSSELVVVIEFVSTPTTPAGPTNGFVGWGYHFTTGNSSSDSGDPIQYRFDWGDGNKSEWLPIGTADVGKAWTAPGTYAVRAQARCGTHTVVLSDWSLALSVTIVPGPPPQTETISTPFIEAYGPLDRGSIYTVGNVISGRKNILYSFDIQSGVSNLGHTTEHQFDWKGDGTTDLSAWGENKKAWPTSGTYLIKVRARCVQHPTVVSEWSSGLYIVIDYITTPTKATWDDQPVDGLGRVGVTYHFSTGGSTSEIGQEIQYRFHWGDTTLSNSGWLPVGTTTASYTYATQGTYTVRVDARGWWYLGPVDTEPSTEHFSYYSPELMVTIRP